MSDCSSRAWEVPRCALPPNGDGSDELVLDAYGPMELVERAASVRIRQLPGAVFVRARECTLTVEYEGYPCSDYRCSACGKVHNAQRPGAFCPRCAAHVTEVVR